MISIIGGTLRHRKLHVPAGIRVRPTANKVRESVFNVLHQNMPFEEMTVLDLYAGTGALGVEAISRGASHAYFIENSPAAFAILKKNIALLKIEAANEIHLIPKTAEKWLPYFNDARRPCLIFIDPPYQQGAYATILPLIERLGTILPDSVVVVESPVKMDYLIPDSLEVLQTKQYGQIKINFLRKCSKSLEFA